MMKPRRQHPIQALSAVKIRNLTKPSKYADGNGLYLIVDASGAQLAAVSYRGDKSVSQKYRCDLIARNLRVPAPWIHLPVKPMQWLGSACEPICRPLRIEPPIYRRRVDFFTKHREFDGSKAERQLGFKPAQTFE